jgi:deoxyadenosine/deoxycytidine kinase
MRQNTQIISIEGNIGSGKSTLVNYLTNEYKNNTNILFLQEPVDIWNEIQDEEGITILEKFYNDTNKYAFQFQMMAYISRLSILKKCLKQNYKYIITERCLYTDANVFAKMLFDDKKISKIEYTIYKKWFDEFINEISISKFIYIKTNPEIAYQRIISRNRIGEKISLEYLIKCNEYHENWISSLITNNNSVLIIDGNNNFNNILSISLYKIKDFIIPENNNKDDNISLFSQIYDYSITQ